MPAQTSPPAPPPSACPSCAHEAVELVGPLAPGVRFAGRVLERPLPGGALWACPACALQFRHPAPPKETLDALYAAGASEAWGADGPRPDWDLAERALRRLGRTGSVLDVGCFDGGFLARLSGWDRYGVELHPEAARRAAARGVRILEADAESLGGIDQRFDAVVAFDLIEHLPDPRRLLAAMAERTRPGGLVLVGTGNTDAPTWRLMGSRYWYCVHPEHLSFIGERWCRAAADALGLELVDLARYSHTGAPTLRRRLDEAAKNLLLRFAPGVFGALRRRGMGELDPHLDPGLALAPPPWITARDHVFAAFRTP